MPAVWASHHEELCSEGVVTRWCLMGDTLGGQPWTPTLRLPYKCDGRSGRRMTVLWTFRRPSMCRPFPCQLMRNGLLDLTTILPVTACHQRNYVKPYSRSRKSYENPTADHDATRPPQFCMKALKSGVGGDWFR